jgi:hypothetical protein
MPFQKNVFLFYEAVIVPLCVLIPMVPALVKYRILSAELKVLSWYLFMSAGSNVITSMLAHNRVNNMPVLHIYTFMELAVLGIFYRKAFGSTTLARYIPILIFSFFALCIANLLFFQNIYTYNTYTKSVEAIIVIFLAVNYFKKTLDATGVQTVHRNVLPYVNSGLLIYFSGSFILFVIPNMILFVPGIFGHVIWAVHATLLLIMYLLFATALWKYKK